MRKMTKKVRIGDRAIGGDSPILIQSMTCTPTSDFEGTLGQILELEKAGCDIARVTVNNMDAVRNVYRLKENSHIPLVADVHFDYRFAVEAAHAGIDKIRINPGNIGNKNNVKKVVDACREKNIPIRIGVNSGSVERNILFECKGPTAQALYLSAMAEVRILEELDFNDIVISVKSSDVHTMIEANRLISQACDYPLHLGVTEAGLPESGIVKSAIGIGSLLTDGIGDTIRVSLTTRDLKQEVIAAKKILAACNLLEHHIDVISCPTCGRTQVDLVSLASKVEEEIEKRQIRPKRNLKVAVMGCVVNGPGEATWADVGIAGGTKDVLLFTHEGASFKKIPEENAVERLMEEIVRLSEEES